MQPIGGLTNVVALFLKEVQPRWDAGNNKQAGQSLGPEKVVQHPRTIILRCAIQRGGSRLLGRSLLTRCMT